MKLEDLKNKAIETFFVNFNKWLASSSRNQFINSGDDKILLYVRKAYHAVDGKIFNTLDIARIEIDDKWQGKGIGKTIIDGIHGMNPFDITFIESILNPNFYTWLKRDGWLDIPNSNPPCVYKETNK